GERLKFTDEKVDGDNAIVRAKVLLRQQQAEVPVEARLLRKGDRWLIYDVLIENVSLVGNYRSQFDRIIRTQGYDELVKRLRTRGEFLRESERARRTERGARRRSRSSAGRRGSSAGTAPPGGCSKSRCRPAPPCAPSSEVSASDSPSSTPRYGTAPASASTSRCSSTMPSSASPTSSTASS